MNAGRIDRNTAAARVWGILKGRRGQLISSWDLSQAARTTAVSTRVSEVRHELNRLHLDDTIETVRIGSQFYYRLKAHADRKQR